MVMLMDPWICLLSPGFGVCFVKILIIAVARSATVGGFSRKEAAVSMSPPLWFPARSIDATTGTAAYVVLLRLRMQMGLVFVELLELGGPSTLRAIKKFFIYAETLLCFAMRVCLMVVPAVEIPPCSANGARIIVFVLHIRMFSCSATRARVVFILEIRMMAYSTVRAMIFLLCNRMVPRSASWARNVVTTLRIRMVS